MTMIDNLRSDFFKLKTAKWLWILPLVVFVLLLAIYAITYSALSLATNIDVGVLEGTMSPEEIAELQGELASSEAALKAMGVVSLFQMPSSLNLYIFVAIAVALFVGSEFSSGVTKLLVARGKNRFGLYASKLVVLSCITIAYTLFEYLVSAILSACFYDFSAWQSEYAGYLIRNMVLSCLVNLSLMSVFVLISYLIRSAGGAIGTSIAVVVIVSVIISAASFLADGNWFKEVGIYLLPSSLLGKCSEIGTLKTADILELVLVPIAYIAATSSIGVATFAKRDIK